MNCKLAQYINLQYGAIEMFVDLLWQTPNSILNNFATICKTILTELIISLLNSQSNLLYKKRELLQMTLVEVQDLHL